MNTAVSIGISIYNEEKYIDNLLNCLLKKKLDFQLKEILIVCSGCTDSSVKIIKKWIEKEKKIKLIIEKMRKGKFSAVNKILKYSKGKYIILIDADTMPLGNTLNSLIETFKDSNVGAVTGRPIFLKTNDTITDNLQLLIHSLHHELSLYFPIMSNVYAIKKGIVNKLPQKIINDDRYIPAVISKTHKIIYQPNSKILEIEHFGFRSYFKYRRRIAQGYIQLSKLGLKHSPSHHLLLKLLMRRLVKEPKSFLFTILAVFIEIYSYIMAFFDVEKGNLDYKWERLV